jgi:penicillin G amidase
MLALLKASPTATAAPSARTTGSSPAAHTASGKPLLSNDMHLTLREPDTWYMADLRAPGFHAAGVTLPGFPFVIAGHNEHVAWGFTALYADVQDLYIEKLDGKGNYEGNDAQWHPLASIAKSSTSAAASDVVVDVESTEHGPLLNPLLAGRRSAHSLSSGPSTIHRSTRCRFTR